LQICGVPLAGHQPAPVSRPGGIGCRDAALFYPPKTPPMR
jgi:hypothetical protein